MPQNLTFRTNYAIIGPYSFLSQSKKEDHLDNKILDLISKYVNGKIKGYSVDMSEYNSFDIRHPEESKDLTFVEINIPVRYSYDHTKQEIFNPPDGRIVIIAQTVGGDKHTFIASGQSTGPLGNKVFTDLVLLHIEENASRNPAPI
jgi:hypothetical protein